MRKLATIREVNQIMPIEGADAIEVAVVDGWNVVTKKGEYFPGDLCVYCEIDSFLPIKDEYEFLRKSSYKKMGEQEGFRLRTIKLRGQLSQGLLLPLSVLGDLDINKDSIGLDVTDMLCITKYETPIPAELNGEVNGAFPSFLRKTDEERVQNLGKKYKNLVNSNDTFYITEKLDGSSVTFYLNEGVFGVCSRNWDLKEDENNTFWKVAKQLNLKDKLEVEEKFPTRLTSTIFGDQPLKRLNLALQGELIGEGIQGNPYNIKGQTVKFFNAFDIDNGKRLSYDNFVSLITYLGLDVVPIIDENFTLPDNIDELLKLSEGKSMLNSKTEREGFVIRSKENTELSFKVISNKFLLNEK